MKKNLVVFANCHGEGYINIMKRDTNIESLFDITYYVSYLELDNFHNLNEDEKNTFIRNLNTED